MINKLDISGTYQSIRPRCFLGDFLTFHNRFGFYTFYHVCERDAKSAHPLISDSFGVVKLCSLRREGRRGWEDMVENKVRMKHMITLEYIKFSFC